VPDADRDHTSAKMLSQTYLSVNSTPQIQNGFNGGIWSSLEGAIRSEVTDYGDTIYIVTGPVFQTVGGNEKVNYITNKGDGKRVPVPNYYYKVVLKVSGSSASAVGFWFEHKEYTSGSYSSYAVSVDEIEQKTGMNFFVNLPDAIENDAESNTSWSTFQSF
jgi:endonuclease G